MCLMDDSPDLLDLIIDRTRPAMSLTDLGVPPSWLWVTVGLGVLLVVAVPAWRSIRIVVTVVHELGHALVGMLAGRTFTGLVLRPDMSGHVVTTGRPRGPGRVATTFAGYPAPALLGAGLVVAATSGWAPPVLAAAMVVLLFSLIRVRSLYTALVMLACLAASAGLWWSAETVAQALVLIVVGIVLLLGSWRHAVAAARSREPGSDFAVLGQITPVPRAIWVLMTLAIVVASTAWTARLLWPLVQP